MSPRVLPVDPRAPEAAALAEAVHVLREGRLVAFPTETVYGLGARALDTAALGRVFEAKGRPKAHPLIAHVVGEADARGLAAAWGELAARLAKAFWPGPLTLVVPRAKSVPAAIAGGGDSIAVRAPAHPVARALIAALGEPIAAPSANRFQQISPTRAEHVVKSLGERVDLVLDGGACDAGIESTVVDVRGARAIVLRPGALGIAAIRAVVPDVESEGGAIIADEDARRASPGMDARHYAPRAKLVLAPSREAAMIEAASRADQGFVGLITRGVALVQDARIDARALPDHPEGYAAALFATLHALDDAGVTAIVVEAVPANEAWWAVADRLRRASS